MSRPYGFSVKHAGLMSWIFRLSPQGGVLDALGTFLGPDRLEMCEAAADVLRKRQIKEMEERTAEEAADKPAVSRRG